MKKVIILLFIAVGLQAQNGFPLYQLEEGAQGEIPYYSWDAILGLYLQKRMPLQDLLNDSIDWSQVPTLGGSSVWTENDVNNYIYPDSTNNKVLVGGDVLPSTSNLYPIQINNSSYATGGIYVDANGGDARIDFGDKVSFGNGNTNVYPYSFDLDAPDNTIEVIDSGNIGIGTNTPANNLSVEGSATISEQLFIKQDPNAVISSSYPLSIRNDTLISGNQMGLDITNVPDPGAALSYLIHIDHNDFDSRFAGLTVSNYTGLIYGGGIDSPGATGMTLSAPRPFAIKVDRDGIGTIHNYVGFRHYSQGSTAVFSGGTTFLRDDLRFNNIIGKTKIDPNNTGNSAPTYALEVLGTDPIYAPDLVDDATIDTVVVVENGVFHKRYLSGGGLDTFYISNDSLYANDKHVLLDPYLQDITAIDEPLTGGALIDIEGDGSDLLLAPASDRVTISTSTNEIYINVTESTVSDTIEGNKIALYTDEDGDEKILNETITGLSIQNDSLFYAKEGGAIDTIPNVGGGSDTHMFSEDKTSTADRDHTLSHEYKYSLSGSGNVKYEMLSGFAAFERTNRLTFNYLDSLTGRLIMAEDWFGFGSVDEWDFRLFSNNTEAFRIDATNNRVGIFNATPSTDLHVVGDSQIDGNLEVENADPILTLDQNNVGNDLDSEINFNNLGTLYGKFSYDYPNNFHGFEWESGTGAGTSEIMTLTHDGLLRVFDQLQIDSVATETTDSLLVLGSDNRVKMRSASGLGGGGGNTVYTADDSLTSNRLLNLDGFSLEIKPQKTGTEAWQFQSTGDLRYTGATGNTLEISEVGGDLVMEYEGVDFEIQSGDAGNVAIICDTEGEVGIDLLNDPTEALDVNGNIRVRDDIVWDGRAMGSMYTGTEASSTSTTWSKIDFTSKPFEDGEITVDIATNDRITLDSVGLYRIEFQADVDGSAAGTFVEMALYVDGTIVSESDFMRLSNKDRYDNTLTISGWLNLTAGQYVELYFRNESGVGTAYADEIRLTIKRELGY